MGRTPRIDLWKIHCALVLILWGCGLFNQKPVIEKLTATKEVVDPSGSAQLSCVALDRDRDQLSYIWSATGGTLSGEGSSVTWSAPQKSGVYTVTVTVSDGRGGEATEQIFLDVLSKENNPPFIKKVEADPWKVDRGKTSKLIIDAYDIDGDRLQYTWSANAGIISGRGPTVTWTAPEKDGNYIITVYATDNKGMKSRKKFITLTVYCECTD